MNEHIRVNYIFYILNNVCIWKIANIESSWPHYYSTSSVMTSLPTYHSFWIIFWRFYYNITLLYPLILSIYLQKDEDLKSNIGKIKRIYNDQTQQNINHYCIFNFYWFFFKEVFIGFNSYRVWTMSTLFIGLLCLKSLLIFAFPPLLCPLPTLYLPLDTPHPPQWHIFVHEPGSFFEIEFSPL